VIRIESADDDRVADYRVVSDPLLQRASGLFVAEGRLVVQRVLEDRRFRPKSLLLSEVSRRALEPWLSTLGADVTVYVCAIDAFRDITGFNIHRGCLALVERPAPLSCADAIEAAKLVVVLENVANPDNMGGIFRNAAAFGVDAVLLSPGCSDPLYRKAIRTSMAASLRVPFARLGAWPGVIAELRARRFVTAALTPREPAMTLGAFVAGCSDRVALLVGTEGAGLSPEIEAAADVLVRIPIRADVDSLNVSAAVAIALHALSARTVSLG